jgi:hypothetical protein
VSTGWRWAMALAGLAVIGVVSFPYVVWHAMCRILRAYEG